MLGYLRLGQVSTSKVKVGYLRLRQAMLFHGGIC